MSNTFSGSDDIRNSKLNEGIKNLKSRISDLEIDVSREIVKEEESYEPKYSKIEVADSMYQLYKDRVAPTAKEDEEILVPNTQGMRASARGLARSLAGLRNTGNAGPITQFTQQANGDVNPGIHNNYGALVVAGTEMTLEEYKEEVEARMEACWAGYKKKGMKTMFGKKYPNCVKEDKGVNQEDDSHFTDSEDVVNEERYKKQRPINAYPARMRQALLNSSTEDRDAAFEKYDKENPRKLPESKVVDELKDELMEMDDHSWVSIDKVMRVLAKEHSITPKELHKLFKKENNGMIPDEWIKENKIMEEAGFMPLEEAINLNRTGNVYEVTGMWHAHTRRIKFFVPLTGNPTREQMQEYFEMFYPGGKLISFYPSMDAGDKTHNEIVVVVPVKEEWIQLERQSWVEMTEEECIAYEYILDEEGHPTSPPMITETGFELWVEDYDTGEEKVITFSEGGLHAWFSKSKSKDGKPGWVQSDGSPCANEKGETKTPKCYSSQRLASLKKSDKGKKLIRSADARKSREDPGQQSKSGGAKPTMVSTFKDPKDKKKYKSGDQTLKDESYDIHYKVWPSAYTSDALLREDDMKGMTVKSGHKRSVDQGAGLTEKGAAAYRRKNPGSKLGTAVTTPPSKLKAGSKAAGRRKSFCARSRGWTGERGKAARARWNC